MTRRAPFEDRVRRCCRGAPGRAVAAALLAGGVAIAGCSRPGWLRVPSLPSLPSVNVPFSGSDDREVAPAPGSGVVVLDASPELEFYQQASQFYQRLTGSRFNSLSTFRDPSLREYFESEESFSDYFADLAQDLAEAHFARNQPVSSVVEEFSVDGPGKARVRTRVVGDNGQPLRFWSTSLVREDRWERRDGRWWIIPGAAPSVASQQE